jgi:hypothetical protein
MVVEEKMMNMIISERSTVKRVAASLPPISLHEVMTELFGSAPNNKRLTRKPKAEPRRPAKKRKALSGK